MNGKDKNIRDIYKIVEPLLGLDAWNVKLGIGSFITMEFGDRITINNKLSRGEWFLWIYCCGWYFENPNHLFLGSEDPRNILKQEIKVIEGHKIESIIIKSISFETNFIFNDDLILHTFPLNFIQPKTYWMLYTPIRKVLILGSNNQWSYKESFKE